MPWDFCGPFDPNDCDIIAREHQIHSAACPADCLILRRADDQLSAGETTLEKLDRRMVKNEKEAVVGVFPHRDLYSGRQR